MTAEPLTTSRKAPAAPDLPPLPELLSPAGSPEALEAALLSGADAVYLGGSSFNARMNAHNFDAGALKEAVTQAHRLGGRVYLTLNTLVYDREMGEALSAAYEAATAGVDGLIVADLGVATLLASALPELPLHASTQLSGHNAAMGRVLAPYGFSRFVIARETSLGDLETAVRESPLEVEVFVHGALCVCHSGQCLFSSVVGGRSGNRGLCAQPCRLPYRPGSRPAGEKNSRGGGESGGEAYPLSLKDLSLARHVPALLRAGVASLKIEGRMKSAGYVGGVTAVWRRLLDERRGASREEMDILSDLFSRGGFTDGYFTGRVNHTMMGIRSAEDKERSARAESSAQAERATGTRGQGRLPLTLTATIRAGEPVSLTASAPLFRQGNTATPVTVTVTGDVPDTARDPAAALSRQMVLRQLGKIGGTAYCLSEDSVTLDMGERLLLPLSRLNALRRQALEELDKARQAAMPQPAAVYHPDIPLTTDSSVPEGEEMPDTPAGQGNPGQVIRTARFYSPSQITPAAEGYFSLCSLPLFCWEPGKHPATRGVILPPVIFDSQAACVRERLCQVLSAGARVLTVCNPGHLPLVRQALEAAALSPAEVTLFGDFRLNVTNTLAAARLFSMSRDVVGTSFAGLILSPELTLPRLRDLHRAFPGRVETMVYGRLPLMLLEKCVVRELYPDKPGSAGAACRLCGENRASLRDRRGMVFPILREYPHRNLILNSLPLSMTDKPEVLAGAGIHRRHFLFTTESPEAVDTVIRCDRQGLPLNAPGGVKRIQ